MTLGTILDWTVLDTGEIDGGDGSQPTLSKLPFQNAVMPLFSSIVQQPMVSSTSSVHNLCEHKKITDDHLVLGAWRLIVLW